MESGIVAIKHTERAKSRIAQALGPDAATRIARALAADTLDLIDRAKGVRWWIVTDDPDVGAEARRRGHTVLVDEGRGFRSAAELGLAAAREAGAASVLLLPADLPLASEEDITEIADVMETSDVVLVPSDGDGGTNALGLSEPFALTPLFGPGSLQAHLHAADQLKLRCTVVASDNLALDLDNPDDIARFLSGGKHARSRAYEVCSELLSEGSGSDDGSAP